MFSPLTMKLLSEAGWNPTRKQDISGWIAALSQAGYVVWPEAHDVLESIGGLVIDTTPYHTAPFRWEQDYAIFEYGDDAIQLDFNPLHGEGFTDAAAWQTLQTVQQTGWKILPIGSLKAPTWPRTPLFLLSTKTIVQGFTLSNQAHNRVLRPIGTSFHDAMNRLFDQYLLIVEASAL